MGNRLICICNMVLENEIIDALKDGANTTKDIQKITAAGTTCGKCLMTIDQIVETYHKEHLEDPQQSLQFD